MVADFGDLLFEMVPFFGSAEVGRRQSLFLVSKDGSIVLEQVGHTYVGVTPKTQAWIREQPAFIKRFGDSA